MEITRLRRSHLTYLSVRAKRSEHSYEAAMPIKLTPVPPGTEHARLCPVRDVLDRIGDRWSFLTLLILANGTHRFTELNRAIGDISKRVLAQTLRALEQDGFVKRRVYATVPPKVEYQLTTLGTSLVTQIEPLVEWADAHHEDVRKARKRYKPPAVAEPTRWDETATS